MRFILDEIDFSNIDEDFYFSFHYDRYLSTLKTATKYCKNGTILDIGSYPFHLFYYLNKYTNCTVIGLDSDPTRSEKFISKNKLNIKKCNIEKNPFPTKDNSVNMVLLCEVFEHLGCNPLFTLHEIRRVLKDDGYLIITTPNLYSLKNILSFLTGNGLGNPYNEYVKIQKYGHMGHIREYSYTEMKSLLNNTNYDIVENHFEHYHSPVNTKVKISLLNIVLFIFPFFKSSQTIICKKK